MKTPGLALMGWFGVVGCAGAVERKTEPDVVRVVFDPDTHRVPLPTDVLRDPAGHLDLPVGDANLTDAEREFYTYLNGLDGWSSAMQVSAEFDAAVDPASIDQNTVQIWDLGATPPRQMIELSPVLDGLHKKLTIDPPRTGWARGGQYVVMVRGGPHGIKGARGEPAVCDAAFYFLRMTQPLDVPAHERAFPGSTHAERVAKAAQAEKARRRLAPYFDWFEQHGVPRNEVIALSPFTVTARVELAMDRASQRMPLPLDLLLDPETGRVDLPPAAWDSPTVLEAKARLAEYDGFSTLGHLTFETTGPIDPASASDASISLVDLSPPATRRVPATLRVLADAMHVVVLPSNAPLAERTRYAVLVTPNLRAADGTPVTIMPIGHFLRSRAPIALAGKSQVGGVDDADAVRLEKVRGEIAPLLDASGRDSVLTAWPFTTMSILEPLQHAIASAQTTGVDPQPASIKHMTTLEAAADFPLAAVTLGHVKEVWTGTIDSPIYLDRVTRARRPDGSYEVQPLAFTMTIPQSAAPGQPLPVVVFEHAIMTERRFVLVVSDALAQQGFAAIAIDLPYHGTRTSCIWSGPLCTADPLSNNGGEKCPDPCESGSTCAPDGRCVDASGQGNHLAMWPVLTFPQASGAAFIELPHIASTKDHFQQALVDLGAVLRSLHQGDWERAIGYPIRQSAIHLAGESLGGIVSATYMAVDPMVQRAVLNVSAGDTVDIFADSPFFSPRVSDFFAQQMIAKGSGEEERFMNVARWFMDAVDPDNVASLLGVNRHVMIQMATQDQIIPNVYTSRLAQLANAPRRDYASGHAFLVVPIDQEYSRGNSELAGFLAGTFAP